MTQLTVYPSCTLESLIDQEGLQYVLSTIYDIVVERLGEDMEWDDPFLYNDPEDVDLMFQALLVATEIAGGCEE